MKSSLISALLAVLFASTAQAAPETYVIDNAHTFPRFEYTHYGYSRQTSRFDKTSGTIVLDRAAKTGSINVVIDATSINSGVTLFNQHLQSEDFFDTEHYPVISFVSDKLIFTGDDLSAVQGNLTLKGITQPVTLTVTSFVCKPHPSRKKEMCGANATTQIKRSDFNMGKYAPNVSDEVTLSIGIEAAKQ